MMLSRIIIEDASDLGRPIHVLLYLDLFRGEIDVLPCGLGPLEHFKLPIRGLRNFCEVPMTVDCLPKHEGVDGLVIVEGFGRDLLEIELILGLGRGTPADLVPLVKGVLLILLVMVLIVRVAFLPRSLSLLVVVIDRWKLVDSLGIEILGPASRAATMHQLLGRGSLNCHTLGIRNPVSIF